MKNKFLFFPPTWWVHGPPPFVMVCHSGRHFWHHFSETEPKLGEKSQLLHSLRFLTQFLRSKQRCQIARLFIFFLLEPLQKTVLTKKVLYKYLVCEIGEFWISSIFNEFSLIIFVVLGFEVVWPRRPWWPQGFFS